MKKTTFSEIQNKFYLFNVEHGIDYNDYGDLPTISAVIVYKQSNFTKPYTEIERSYRITNHSGKRFFPNMGGNSIYGNCLDGKDLGVRLDYYNWKIEYCYFEGEENV